MEVSDQQSGKCPAGCGAQVTRLDGYGAPRFIGDAVRVVLETIDAFPSSSADHVYCRRCGHKLGVFPAGHWSVPTP